MAQVEHTEPPERVTLPYGSWPSPIQVEDLLTETVSLSEPAVDGDDVYWIEGRPSEAGRSVLVRRTAVKRSFARGRWSREHARVCACPNRHPPM